MTIKQPTVYALPGTMCDQSLWTDLNNAGLDFSLRHVDIPTDHTMEAIITTLEKNLPNDEPIHLLGFSLGGYLASLYACKNPDRVAKLAILANTPARLPDTEITQRQQVIHWVEKNGYSGMPLNKVRFLLHKNNADKAAIVQQIIAMDKNCGEAVLLQQLKATTERDNLCPQMASLDKPIAFFFGEQDKLVNATTLKTLAQSSEKITYHMFSDAGHMLPLEAPNSLAQKLNAFF